LVTPGNDWVDPQLAQASFASFTDLIFAKCRKEGHWLSCQSGQLNRDDSSSSSWLFQGAVGTADLTRRRKLIDGQKGDPFEMSDHSESEISWK
jgi:hypothetical protein